MEAAYAIYKDGELKKLLVINMHGYNTTKDGAGVEPMPNPPKRPIRTFSFDAQGEWKVQRLMANGSDAITGITFDGWSYNWELDQGRPVRLGNVTTGETVEADGNILSVDVPDSSAVLLSL